ncbi:hypothetical protein BDC45DRAFT_575376 [Circinella umbellata]|nr:hypothetical protein BDC45DRAFT_575376 [Circinella umbellata]
MTKDELKSNLNKYAKVYYADSEWAYEVSSHIENRLENLQGNKYLSLVYFGCTHASDPDKRLHHNITKAQHTPGLMESTWITAVGNLSLNSAKGGLVIDWIPSQYDIKIWNSLKIIPSINPCPTKAFLKAVIETATPTKVTAQNIRNEIGFWDLSAGVAPDFFKELVRYFSPTEPLPVQVDLFPLSPQKIIQIGILYTTRYLQLVQPTVILVQSSLVNRLLQLDIFSKSWLNNFDDQQMFLKQLQSPDSLAGLSSFLNTCYPTTNIKRKFTSQIGLVSIARYGPAPSDICLSMAIQDPGNLRYDPSNQQAKCQELYATLCCFYMLEDVIHQHQQESPRPKNMNEFQVRLLEIKKQYEQQLEHAQWTPQI